MVFKDFGRFEAFEPVTIQVARTAAVKAESFQLSRLSRLPRLVMELPSGHLALTNVFFLVSDAVLASEDMLISIPVLQDLGIALRTLLKRNRAELDTTDCFAVPRSSTSKTCGFLGSFMIAQHQCVTEREPINGYSTAPP